MPSALSELKTASEKGSTKAKELKKEIEGLKARLQTGIANLSDAEVTFLYGIVPLSGNIPLFTAYGEWLTATLEHYGFDQSQARPAAAKCEKERWPSHRSQAFIAPIQWFDRKG